MCVCVSRVRERVSSTRSNQANESLFLRNLYNNHCIRWFVVRNNHVHHDGVRVRVRATAHAHLNILKVVVTSGPAIRVSGILRSPVIKDCYDSQFIQTRIRRQQAELWVSPPIACRAYHSCPTQSTQSIRQSIIQSISATNKPTHKQTSQPINQPIDR